MSAWPPRGWTPPARWTPPSRSAASTRFTRPAHPIESLEHEPAAVLLEQVRRLAAGLIVMGAYGEPVLREFFLGSVSRTLLKESPVPVFLAH